MGVYLLYRSLYNEDIGNRFGSGGDQNADKEDAWMCSISGFHAQDSRSEKKIRAKRIMRFILLAVAAILALLHVTNTSLADELIMKADP